MVLLTLFRMDIFEAAHGWGWVKRPPFSKVSHTYLSMMKLGTVITYLKKIQKTYKLRGTPVSSADISIFHRKLLNCTISKNTDIDCILIHNF